MFNRILNSGHFPDDWSKAVIIPVFKKGDRSNPSDYRGISLISCLCKLFTSILNTRLLKWIDDNDILTDAQFGFRHGMSTVDAIFSLYSIIQKTFLKKKRLYCCFVDFKKAFDTVDRFKLWYKLGNMGLGGKILNIMKSMYNNVKSCISIGGLKSDYFANKLGLMQGEVLSPVLFAFYVNDFEMEFIRNSNMSVEMQDLDLFVLLYADDMILFSESVDG